MPDTATHSEAKRDHQRNRSLFANVWDECVHLRHQNAMLHAQNTVLKAENARLQLALNAALYPNDGPVGERPALPKRYAGTSSGR